MFHRKCHISFVSIIVSVLWLIICLFTANHFEVPGGLRAIAEYHFIACRWAGITCVESPVKCFTNGFMMMSGVAMSCVKTPVNVIGVPFKMLHSPGQSV